MKKRTTATTTTMNPEHLELLKRALPHIRDPRVVEIVVGALAQGSDYPVPDITTVEYIDFTALRLCFWASRSAEKAYPDTVVTSSSFVRDHYADLKYYLDLLEQCAPPAS